MSTAYERLAARAWERNLAAFFLNEELAGKVRVLGEPSSGTRLVTRLIDASPDLDAWHDHAHGAVAWGTEPRAVILVRRDPLARLESATARWGDKSMGVPFPDLRRVFPSAPVVHYEDVVADPDAVIASLASYFEVLPWKFGERIYNANERRGTRERRHR